MAFHLYPRSLFWIGFLLSSYSFVKCVKNKNQEDSFAAKEEPDPLYEEGDNVVILDEINFENTVLGTDCAWLIEFYSSWCGHCIAFAPIFKQLAKEVKGWHKVIQVGGVDCALEKNLKLCRGHNITSYPTLFLFEANSQPHDLGYKYEGNKTVEAIKNGMVDHVIKHHPMDRPASWPVLEPAWYTTVSSFWADVKDQQVQYVVLVFQEPFTFYGLHVILDLLPLQSVVVRVVFQDNELLMKELQVKEVPALYMVKRSGEYFRVTRDTFLRRGISGAESLLRQVVGSGGRQDDTNRGSWSRVALKGPSKGAAAVREKEKIPDKYSFQQGAGLVKSSPERPLTYVHMQDLESALHYSLRQEVASHQTISGPHLTALKAFLGVLAQYFPGRAPVKAYLAGLNKWLLSRGNLALEAHTWLNQLDQLMAPARYLPKVHRWVGCLGSKTYLRGYPCSLWTLWHVLTVAEQQAMLEKDPNARPMEVLGAMRGYISLFFSCAECSDNFSKMAATMEQEVDSGDPASSVLWLWRAHNKANARLKGAESEDPHFPKVQFPSPAHCPKCHHETTGGGDQWNMDVVSSFLTLHYGADLISQDGLRDMNGQVVAAASQVSTTRENRRRLYTVGQGQQQQQTQSSPEERVISSPPPGSSGGRWGWLGYTGVDLSMCVMLYLLCVTIILLLYCIITRRPGKLRRSKLRLPI